MPIYMYECSRCLAVVERVIAYDKRDEPQNCKLCDEAMERLLVTPWTNGKPAYQMQAVLGDGQHIRGHFGKDAARKKRG